MRLRAFTLGVLTVGTLVQPCYAQIIATSIPREEGVAGQPAGERKKFAFHIMASPFAKWKINKYVESPQGSPDPTFISASTTNSSSKFVLAAEAAFAAGDNVTVGVGGWFNNLGTVDTDFLELDFDFGEAAFGVATEKLRVFEVHGNAFYKDIGLQLGIVRTTGRITGFRAGTIIEDLVTGEAFVFTRDVSLDEAGFPAEDQSVTNWDAFLVYKRGGPTESRFPWSTSVGAGVYRDSEAGSTAFSGFVTGSVQLFRGLGIDASLWYVGGKKQTTTQQELGQALETAVSDNLTRFTIGIGYSFSK